MTQIAGELAHNPKNAVTYSLQRVRHADGSSYIRKVLNCLNNPQTPAEWRAASEPRHWNYWRRESLVYQSRLAAELQGSGVRLAGLRHVETTDERITLQLEDIQGRTGAALQISDYQQICRAWGRAQAQLMQGDLLKQGWMSRQFLRQYTGSKPVNYDLLNSSRAWQQPLIADNWPAELREGLCYLTQKRQALYDILEAAPQVLCHLDFWPNNVFIDSREQVVLIDLGFMGAGALAEDVGNFIPDAIFDEFMPPGMFAELEHKLFAAYLLGLQAGGAVVDQQQLQRQLFASAVKYVWLGPLLLSRAGDAQQVSYGNRVLADANQQYRARGATLLNLCGWAQRALS